MDRESECIGLQEITDKTLKETTREASDLIELDRPFDRASAFVMKGRELPRGGVGNNLDGIITHGDKGELITANK